MIQTQAEDGMLDIRVVRLNEVQKGNNLTTSEIYVNVLFWAKKGNVMLELHEINNVGSLIQLDLHLLPIPELKIRHLPNPLPIVYFNQFNKVNNEKIDLDFNSDDRFVFAVVVTDKTAKPTGKRRRVVIYEDTDILDSGEVDNSY